MKLIEKSLIIGFLFTLLFNITKFANNCENLNTKVFRLHILANSNSDADQNLKLKVRDKIISESNNFLCNALDKKSTKNLVIKNLNNIKKIAENEINTQGFHYPVKLEITNMYFSTRKYGNMTMPAGNYDALRVIIGNGSGKNWWCVLFPQICLNSAQNNTKIDYVLNDFEQNILNNGEKYEIKFKIVEWFYWLKNYIFNLFFQS